jgi:peptidoglycan/xylan/chitin deacetylase (PgdA/CDA1 family)
MFKRGCYTGRVPQYTGGNLGHVRRIRRVGSASQQRSRQCRPNDHRQSEGEQPDLPLAARNPIRVCSIHRFIVGDKRRVRYTVLILLCLLTVGVTFAQTQTPVIPERVESSWDGTYRRIRVPILMYHYVSDLPEGADATRTDLTLTPATFAAHMEYLFYQGYTPVSLYALDDALLTGTPLPAKPVVLTFDDGYVDHYTNVLPVLQQYGYTGTFFIITGTADAENPEHLSWTQITSMAEAGMDMESHTKTHPDLRGRDYDFLTYQLLGSIESLQAFTGKTPHMFAYPVGNYDDAVLGVLKTLPVWRAVTTERGVYQTTDNRLEMPRLRIHHTTGVAALAAILQE